MATDFWGCREGGTLLEEKFCPGGDMKRYASKFPGVGRHVKYVDCELPLIAIKHFLHMGTLLFSGIKEWNTNAHKEARLLEQFC